jgi:hypothetical protein
MDAGEKFGKVRLSTHLGLCPHHNPSKLTTQARKRGSTLDSLFSTSNLVQELSKLEN